MRGLATVLLVLGTHSALAGDRGIQLFNTQVFGRPTSEAVKLLVDKAPGDAEPFVIWTDVECGEYFAASVFYRTPVAFEELRAALNRQYAPFELAGPSSKDVPWSTTMAMWRVTDPASVSAERPLLFIQLTTDEDEGVRVIYIRDRLEPCSSRGPDG